MTGHFILNASGEPEPCGDLLTWARWIEAANRSVMRDTIGDVRVSTVFLGLDHSFGQGEPLLYETMIFGGEHDSYQDRYATKAEALVGHKKALSLIVPDGPAIQEEK